VTAKPRSESFFQANQFAFIRVHSRLATDALFSSALSKSWVSNVGASQVWLIEVDHWKPKIAHRLVEEFEFAAGLMNREDDYRRWLDSKPGRGRQ
jgi:hypothetical protein